MIAMYCGLYLLWFLWVTYGGNVLWALYCLIFMGNLCYHRKPCICFVSRCWDNWIHMCSCIWFPCKLVHVISFKRMDTFKVWYKMNIQIILQTFHILVWLDVHLCFFIIKNGYTHTQKKLIKCLNHMTSICCLKWRIWNLLYCCCSQIEYIVNGLLVDFMVSGYLINEERESTSEKVSKQVSILISPFSVLYWSFC